MLQTFAADNFSAEVLKSKTPVLVDFWAPWCGPCQMTGPMVEELAEEFAGKGIKIGKCDVDANADLAERYEIMSIPAFLVFKGGEIVDKMVGAAPKEKIKSLIEKNL